MMMISTMIMIGERPLSWSSAAVACGTPARDMKIDRKAAPSRIR